VRVEIYSMQCSNVAAQSNSQQAMQQNIAMHKDVAFQGGSDSRLTPVYHASFGG